jgi:hypothetical protein
LPLRFPCCQKLVYSLDDEVLINACWAISYLSDGSNDKIQAVIEAGIPHRLVEDIPVKIKAEIVNFFLVVSLG